MGRGRDGKRKGLVEPYDEENGDPECGYWGLGEGTWMLGWICGAALRFWD